MASTPTNPALPTDPASILQSLATSTPGQAQNQDVEQEVLSQQMMNRYAQSQAQPQSAPVAQTQFPVDAQQAGPQTPQQVSGDTAHPPFQMIPISRSSTIKTVGYDYRAQELHVIFKSSDDDSSTTVGPDTYVYSKVPPEKFEGLIKAESMGKYHFNEIKGKKYPFRKVKPVPPQL